MSKWFETAKRYYERKLWSKEQVEAAAKYGRITQEECAEILGES